ETLDIRELRLYAGELPSLILGEVGIVERKMIGRRRFVVEPVHHQKVDHLIAPVRGRRERRGIAGAGMFCRFEYVLKFGREKRARHNRSLGRRDLKSREEISEWSLKYTRAHVFNRTPK